MAMRNENDIPGLIPFDDRYPDPGKLYRRSEDISDDQFAFLAAAWAEGSLDGEQIAEFETIIAGNPERKAMAEDLKRIRLIPGHEKWPGKVAQLKQASPPVFLKRTMIAFMAAAVFIAFFTLPPLLKNSISESTPVMLPVAEVSASPDKPVPPDKPAILSPARGNDVTLMNPREKSPVNPVEPVREEAGTVTRTLPLTMNSQPERVRLIAGISSGELRSVPLMRIPETAEINPDEVNWIMRGVTAISKAISKDDRPVDGYLIAGACVKGINSFFGWKMELERVLSEEGNPREVRFNSSLLSFSSPVKKNIQVP